MQFHSDRRPLQERVSAVLSSVCHRADASRNITARTEARNDHTQQPRATTTRNNHTQRPHATTTRNNRAQQPRATTKRDDHTQQPHATTTRNDHTQRPHATTTRNNHTHRPHATTARSHRASRRVARIRVERTPWRTIARRKTHRTKPAGVKAARICWAIRRSTATACRGEVGCTSEPSHASRPRERSERVGQEAPCVLHELSGDDPHDR